MNILEQLHSTIKTLTFLTQTDKKLIPKQRGAK
jgi:hypothetical protein